MPEAEMARGTKQERRHAAILQRLRETGTAKVEDLCVELGVSMHTIRRDLEELHERGVLRRVHGGAAQLEPLFYEPFRADRSFQEQMESFADEKRRIALAAASMVLAGETVALSPGTTTTQVARSLRHREGIHIVTSAVNIGMELSSLPNMKLTLTGGAIRWPGSFSMVGATAFESLQLLFFDKVFIGACGIHPQYGITVIESDEALILSEMIKHARQVIAVADSSKLGMISAMQVCSPSQIHSIITDDGADLAVLRQFEQQGIRVFAV